MKKLFTIVIFMAAIGSTSILFAAGERLGSQAWGQMRELHAQYLGRQNTMSYGETKDWIAQRMLSWLDGRNKKYEKCIQDLEEEVKKLKEASRVPCSTCSALPQLKAENLQLNNELIRCKMWRNIAISVIAIILMLFIAFILIKKCQAKKVPKSIEDATCL